jgi:hypothetical protein
MGGDGSTRITLEFTLPVFMEISRIDEIRVPYDGGDCSICVIVSLHYAVILNIRGKERVK